MNENFLQPPQSATEVTHLVDVNGCQPLTVRLISVIYAIRFHRKGNDKVNRHRVMWIWAIADCSDSGFAVDWQQIMSSRPLWLPYFHHSSALGSCWRLGGGDELYIWSVRFVAILVTGCAIVVGQKRCTLPQVVSGWRQFSAAPQLNRKVFVKFYFIFKKLWVEKMGDKLLKWSSWWRNSQKSSWFYLPITPSCREFVGNLWCHYISRCLNTRS